MNSQKYEKYLNEERDIMHGKQNKKFPMQCLGKSFLTNNLKIH